MFLYFVIAGDLLRLYIGFMKNSDLDFDNLTELYKDCTQCPRNCRVNRLEGIRGFCGETCDLRIAYGGIHFGEEPPITGESGSGTIFFTGCNLRCSFCQNYQISQDGMGKILSKSEFAELCLKLQESGAENINLVTGSHHIPVISAGLEEAKKNGLVIPVLWNTSSYENPESLEMLESLVDVWLPDLKTLNPEISRRVFFAEDYPAKAKRAIRWMAVNSPLKFIKKAGKEKIVSGVILRHLALPGRLDDTRLVIKWFSEALEGRALLSLMTQYTPVNAHKNKEGLKAFQNRHISEQEYESLKSMLEEYGIQDGFYQELENDDSWLPDFNNLSPFPSSLSRAVWHWSKGFV